MSYILANVVFSWQCVKDCSTAEGVPLAVWSESGSAESLTRRGTPFMVFDTEMYARKLASRNTGGQASKASNIGEVCQFAATGKEMGKKSLSEIAMSYGYVYVAQIALGANPAQALKAIQEAEAYNGPSLIIGYAPCELHGVKGGS